MYTCPLTTETSSDLADLARLLWRLVIELTTTVGSRWQHLVAAIDRCTNRRRFGLSRFPNAATTTWVQLVISMNYRLADEVRCALNCLICLPGESGANARFLDDRSISFWWVVFCLKDLWTRGNLRIRQSVADS